MAENNDNIILYEYDDEILKLSLRWINEEVEKGPYSLFMAINVKDDRIENIFIDDLEIKSTKEIEYKFKSVSFPFLIYNVDKNDSYLEYEKDNDKIRYYQFTDKFKFDFKGNEEFILSIKLRYEGNNINEKKEVKIRYKPFIEEFHAPFL